MLTDAEPAGGRPDLAGLEPLERLRPRWPRILGALLSGLMILGLAWELFDHGWAGVELAAPDSPWFYLFFALAYFSPPLFDFIIFRALWRLPFDGFGALVRKRIANDVVIGYSGDVFFYAWARARLKMVTAPFGAVKDVTILSGIAGNIVTVGMLAVALPFAFELFTPPQLRMLAWSSAVAVGISGVLLLFSRRVFSLPGATLRWIFGVHAARLVLGSLAFGIASYFAMPNVSITWWLFLAAGRLVVARLPLLPNKDLLFANFAIMFIGHGEALSDLVAFIATLTLFTHVVLMAVFGLPALARKE
ncbi:hypothetical protein [Sphingomonas hankookensis]|uniref:Flippase-like domain-containing protein n=1 Tax=Sphingomonas hengshuiensis TaxID=1609977 RepID=A0A2W4ZK40_9SPHN|nr:MAG: hypothetical protein DI632_00230 [Sphingomonas hengshuiensis]